MLQRRSNGNREDHVLCRIIQSGIGGAVKGIIGHGSRAGAGGSAGMKHEAVRHVDTIFYIGYGGQLFRCALVIDIRQRVTSVEEEGLGKTLHRGGDHQTIKLSAVVECAARENS